MTTQYQSMKESMKEWRDDGGTGRNPSSAGRAS